MTPIATLAAALAIMAIAPFSVTILIKAAKLRSAAS